ncbi:MAG: PTS sugar transporter subunit IIA, partial [Gammaproteobacteria bacterium]|nr:PTS sugar transporter subunit IIA [Gammaproteobacteria bacterium]
KGSTAIGHGIAIPHCRLKKCDHVVGGLFHLQDYIDFNAFDGQPVNILFVLIVPEDETTLHLEILSLLARKFDSEDFRKELLAASTDQDLYQKAIG